MVMDTRTRAMALLDTLGVGTEGDRTQAARDLSQEFTACFVPGHGMGSHAIARTLLDGLTDPEAAAAIAKVTRYPSDALAWAWADNGMLDKRLVAGKRAGHPWDAEGVTPMGAAIGWWMPPKVPKGTLVLASDTGPGKTVAAVYVAVRKRGTFLRAADLGEIALGKGRETLERLSYEPLLVIDEIGRESDIRPTPQRVAELLGTRHDRGLGTLVTTQLAKTHEKAINSFADRYGHHILDRVVRAGQWIDIRLPSRRGSGQPKLDGLLRACRIAELVPRVVAMTSATARPDPKAITELQRLMNIDDDEIADAAARRESWTRPLLDEAARIPGVVGGILRRVAAGEHAPEDRRVEVEDE